MPQEENASVRVQTALYVQRWGIILDCVMDQSAGLKSYKYSSVVFGAQGK